MSQLTIYLQGKPVELSQAHYKGAGGEGTIYARHGKAYKIYHDSTKCVPEGKIKELSQIGLPNVMNPQDIITDHKGKAIGFSMPFVERTEYLCKLFTKGFCETHAISPQDTIALVKIMQDTLEKIHQKKILVVDYNEMNFLTDLNFSNVLHIDVDCYQTPHYPATAIMASIRDPQVKNNNWTEESDWFSFGILACQLYIKTHPYKGRHPDHGKDWQAMMSAGISIFNQSTRMPPATLDLSVIPKGHRKWLERVMEHGERCKPPEADQDITPSVIPKAILIASTQSVEVTEVQKCDSDIFEAKSINGSTYVITRTGLFREGKKIHSFPQETGYQAKRIQKSLCHIEGNAKAPAILEFNPLLETLRISDIDKVLNETLETQGYFVTNNRIYLTNSNGLVEVSLLNMGAKPISAKSVIAQIFHQHIVLPGMVIQDVLGKCTITIPHSEGKAKNTRFEPLDKHRILNGKHEKGFAIVLSEFQGKIWKNTIVFDKTFTSFTYRQEETSTQEEINFTVLDKGICVLTNEDKIEVFATLDKKKIVENSPIESTHKLRSWQNQVFAINKKQLLSVSLK